MTTTTTLNPGADPAKISSGAARLAIGASAATLALLASLHALSPEFDPSWRMVSEYAFGRFGVVLSAMFLAWAIGSWALAAAIWSQASSRIMKIGLVFLLVAGLGEAMAAVYDIRHDLGHSIAGLLGVGGLPVAALLISLGLRRDRAWQAAGKRLLSLAHLTWISVALLFGTMIVMTLQLLEVTGGKLPHHAPKVLPAGVIGLDGWANRLIVASFCVWVAAAAWQALRLKKQIDVA